MRSPEGTVRRSLSGWTGWWAGRCTGRPLAFRPFPGDVEVTGGLGLLAGRSLRIALLFFLLQMAGTFLVLVGKPEVAFQGYNPFLLTTEGELVIKNLVLISGGLLVGSKVRNRRSRRERQRGDGNSAGSRRSAAERWEGYALDGGVVAVRDHARGILRSPDPVAQNSLLSPPHHGALGRPETRVRQRRIRRGSRKSPGSAPAGEPPTL